MKKCKPGEFRGNPDGESQEVMPKPKDGVQTLDSGSNGPPPKKPPVPEV